MTSKGEEASVESDWSGNQMDCGWPKGSDLYSRYMRRAELCGRVVTRYLNMLATQGRKGVRHVSDVSRGR
jgi:hypothetical protein